MIYRFDNVVIDRAAFRLLKDGTAVRLEPKAFEVLVHLIEGRDRVVSKQELLDEVWRGTAVTENSLTRAVAQIRKVLGDDLQSPRYIQTVPTKGYRFIAALEPEPAPASLAGPVSSEPPLIVRQDARHPPPRALPRSPVVAVLGAVLLVLLGSVAVSAVGRYLTWRLLSAGKSAQGKGSLSPSRASSRASSPPPPIVARALRVTPNVQAFPAFSPDDSSVAYSLEVDGTPHIFTSTVSGTEETQVTRGDGETQPAWSPDGKLIAYVALKKGGIWTVPVAGGEPVQVTTFGSRPRWSPDGREIAFQSGEGNDYGWTAYDALPPSVIWIVDVSTRRATALTKPGSPAGGHGAPAWRRDGNRLTFSSCEVEWCGVFTVARDGSGIAAVVTDSRRLSSPVFARDGDAIYYVLMRYNDSLLLSVAIDGSGARSGTAPVVLRQSRHGVMQHLALSDDGFRLAWTQVEDASDLYSIPLVRSEGGTAPPGQLTRNAALRATFPVFSPDGTKIAYSAVAAGDDSGIWIMDADGANAKAVEVGPGLKQHTGWVRDGYSLVYSAWDEGPALFQVSLITGGRDVLRRLPPDASGAVLSPDDVTIAFNRTIDKVTSVWTATRDDRPRRVTKNGDLARFPVWSPTGRYLAVQVRTERGGSAVGVVDLETKALKVITTEPGDAQPYGWSPDEKEISFAARRDGVWNIYTVPVRGGRERKLTDNESTSVWFRFPVWSPTRDRIVYEAGAPKANVWISGERAVQ